MKVLFDGISAPQKADESLKLLQSKIPGDAVVLAIPMNELKNTKSILLIIANFRRPGSYQYTALSLLC